MKLLVDDYTYTSLTEYAKNTGREVDSIVSTMLDKIISDENNRSTTAQNNTKSAGGLLYRAYTYWLSKYDDIKFSRNDFIDAFIDDAAFNEMFKEYMLCGFDSKKRPSFIYHKKLKKIGLVTYSERMQQQSATNGKPVIQLSYDKEVKEFPSIKAASRESKVDVKTIRNLLKKITTGAPKRIDFIYAKDNK